ncbi:MAG: hypothetical protein SPL35_05220 [Bacteroidales bacterium]|nr:hypothetical protein [Bacteroidales bacterium]
MKKILVLALAAFALFSCQKENAVESSKEKALVFDITVNQMGTKAVKTDFADGDKIYVFFEDVTGANYVTLEKSGSDWNASVTGTISGLSASGKKMYAVHFPFEQPEIIADGEGVKFRCSGTSNTPGLHVYTYYMTNGSGSDYTVTDTDDASTVAGTLSMSIPDGFVQFFINTDGAKYNKDNTYRLSIQGIKPTACSSYANGVFTEKNDILAAQPIWGYAYGSDGVAFTGKIDDTWSNSANSHVAYLFDTEDVAKTQTFTGKTLSSGNAVNIKTAWTNAAPTISSVVNNGKTWADRNLGATTADVTSEDSYGWYFAWGDIIPATRTTAPGANFGGDTYYQKTIAYEALNGKTEHLKGAYSIYDAATAFLGPNWRMPEQSEFETLVSSYNWGGRTSDYDHTSLIDLQCGSVWLPAAGDWYGGSFHDYLCGYYWSSSCDDGTSAYSLGFRNDRGSGHVDPGSSSGRYYGQSVRPLQN